MMFEKIKNIFVFVKHIQNFYRFWRDYGYSGEICAFIIENYQRVLSNRTSTMSKPTYYANDIMAEMDAWYENHGVPMDDKLVIKSDGFITRVFVDGMKVDRCVRLEMFEAHPGEVYCEVEMIETNDDGSIKLVDDNIVKTTKR